MKKPICEGSNKEQPSGGRCHVCGKAVGAVAWTSEDGHYRTLEHGAKRDFVNDPRSPFYGNPEGFASARLHSGS
jgi:hypothetical protein